MITREGAREYLYRPLVDLLSRGQQKSPHCQPPNHENHPISTFNILTTTKQFLVKFSVPTEVFHLKQKEQFRLEVGCCAAMLLPRVGSSASFADRVAGLAIEGEE